MGLIDTVTLRVERFNDDNSQYINYATATGVVMMGMTSNEWELNERRNEYLKIGDIIDRFNHIDEVYGHTPWTLEQIYSNLNILVGKVIEDGKIG